MEALDLTTFITAESLKTFAGQVLAIVVFTQLTKELGGSFLNGILRWIAVSSGLWIQSVNSFLDGIYLQATLVTLNGAIVALVAMKGAEMIKSKAEKPPIDLKPEMVVLPGTRPDPLKERRENETAGKP